MRVLVACGEPVTRLLLQSTIGRAGHEVVGCRSARDAMDAVQGSGRPDLAFVDAALPGKEAEAVCLALGEHSPRPRIVLLTRGGPTAAAEAAAGRAAGADLTLERPLSADTILTCVKVTAIAAGAQPTAPTRDPLIGRVLDDKYEVLEPVGKGGMGTIYRARHRVMGELVALKVIHPTHVARPGFRERFVREARVMLRMTHPNLITVRDCGVTRDDLPYLTMDLSTGRSLGELLRVDGRLEEARVAALGEQIARALGAAHERGIVHRDLKPENVLVEAGDRVRVCDFGLAKLLDDDRAADVTGQGTVVGTPYYMAPEQAAGEPLEGRADVYSLGCILYQAVTGARVFEANSVSKLLRAHLTEVPAAPSTRGVAVSPRLEALILRMLAKDAEARPTAITVAQALAAIGTNRASARRLSILVADDSAVNRTLLAGILQRWGHSVTLASDGQEALERFATAGGAFDMVLLDGDMPRMGGAEAARALRAHPRAATSLAVIGLTANEGPVELARSRDAGMDQVLAKPVRVAELEGILARIGARGPGAPGAALFDKRAALDRVEGDEELLRETIGLLLSDLDRLLRELRDAHERGDLTVVARAAHELKGSAANCGAMAVAAAAARIEASARTGELADVQDALVHAEQDVASTVPLLRSTVCAA